MFTLAILIGIYSYIIFSLGILGKLMTVFIWPITIIFLLGVIYWKKNIIFKIPKYLKIFLQDKKIFSYLIIFLILVFINLLGVLAPEISFDALWYHLTLPKLYLLNSSIFHIPGNLLYYSDMPKLAETIYISALSFGNMYPKFVHFSFGIAVFIAIYQLMNKYSDRKTSFLASLIFYSNLVVLWESTTAYIDLVRTFFEIMALWGFMNWWEKGEKKWLVESSVMIGLAISVKFLSIGSIFIFLALITFKLVKNKSSILSIFTSLSSYIFISLLIPLPWFVFSYINTKNPFYPFFTDTYRIGFNQNFLSPIQIANDFWNLFARSSDPIAPLYVIFLPLAIILFKRLKTGIRIIFLYSLLALMIWYLTPRTGGGRFILPYLPAFSIITAGVIAVLEKEGKLLKRLAFCLLIFVFLISIVYRSIASLKYVPVVLGKESKSKFLSKNLNFNFGDFYDIDNYFKNNIKKEDKVLLYGFHNLYYVDFPFVDSSWVKKGEKFNYIAVQNSKLPERFYYWKLVHENKKTKVKVYSMGGQTWVY